MLKKTILTATIVLFIISLAYIFLTQPYLKRGYVRVADKTELIEVEYSLVTGDPLCTNLYLVSQGRMTDVGVFPSMPPDVPDPHDTNSLQEGDRLKLAGYLYEWREENRITGTVEKRSIYNIDVVAWEVLGEVGVAYSTGLSDTSKRYFQSKNYTDCRQ